MSTVTNSTEDILEIKSSTDYLLLPFLILLISNLKFTIGRFADKHLIYKEGMKIPKEEYFYINESNGDVLHRPYDWCEFLLEFGYSVLLEDALLYHTDILDLERKYKFDSLEH